LPETFKTPIWKDHSSEVRLNLNKLEIPLVLNYVIVVLQCMFGEIRPDFEVVKERRILHFAPFRIVCIFLLER